MAHNFINLTEAELDKPIYRVFSSKWFFDMIDNKKNSLRQPSKWDDPFENFMLNATGELSDGLKVTVESKDHLYGQCWTTKRESDAIWRIYSPNNDGVKVKTTIRKLFNALYIQAGEFKDISCFIGKVQYANKTKLIEQLSNPSQIRARLTDSTGYGQASTLLYKRLAFSHEKEVRLIYYSPTNLKTEWYHFKFDPRELFEQIVFDPRMGYKKYKTDKERLINQFGFKIPIIKSSLYKIPELSFKM